MTPGAILARLLGRAAPQGHWGGETKPTHMSRVLLRRNAPRIECCRRAAVACGRDQRLGFLDENRSCSCNYASKLLLNTARREVTIYTTTEGIGPVEALLEDNGVEGYVLEDAADFEEFLKDTEIYWDYVDEDLVREKRAQETCLKIYLPDSDEGAKQYADIRAALENLKARDEEHAWGRLCTETALTRQEDWEWGWKQYFKPFPVGRGFMIKPSWETVEDPQGRRILEIDPASSFGTGSHDTTQLCMMALEDAVKPGDKLLDMGTGSGILAIAAAMLGADVQTIVDIDENCLKTAHENAEKNHVEIGRGLCGDALRDPKLAENIGGGYDVIVANIVADVIIGMSPMFADKLVKGGTLICSGILNERAEEVRAALEKSGFTILSHEKSDDWSAFAAKK